MGVDSLNVGFIAETREENKIGGLVFASEDLDCGILCPLVNWF